MHLMPRAMQASGILFFFFFDPDGTSSVRPSATGDLGYAASTMQAVVFESTTTMDQGDFERWVDERAAWDPNRYELLNGRIVVNPPAGYPHGSVGSMLQCLLVTFVRAHRLGRVFDSSQGIALPSGDTVEPDHSFVSAKRWAASPPPEHGKFLRVVPDLVVEVLSTATASRDRGEKKAIYERNAVREYWLVDTRSRELRVFVLGDARFDAGTLVVASERWRSTVVEGLEVSPDEIFAEVDG